MDEARRSGYDGDKFAWGYIPKGAESMEDIDQRAKKVMKVR